MNTERHKLLASAEDFHLAHGADNGPLRRRAFGRSVEQQHTWRIVPVAHGGLTEAIQRLGADGRGDGRVVYVHVDGTKAVTQQAGIKRARVRRPGNCIRRVAPRFVPPGVAHRSFAGRRVRVVVIVHRHRPKASVPKLRSERMDFLRGAGGHHQSAAVAPGCSRSTAAITPAEKESAVSRSPHSIIGAYLILPRSSLSATPSAPI